MINLVAILVLLLPCENVWDIDIDIIISDMDKITVTNTGTKYVPQAHNCYYIK